MPSATAGDWRAILHATGNALRATQSLAKETGSTDVATLRRQVALINKPELRLLLAATHVGLRQCAAVAGPTVQIPLQAR